MLTKIYLILLAVFVLVMSFLEYYAGSWLESIDKPEVVFANYSVLVRIFHDFLWISSLILLVLANVILWTRRSSWALWTTLVYFAAFVIINYFWIDNLKHQFYIRNNMAETILPLGALSGVGLCAAAALVVFFNQFAVLRLTEKMYPSKELPASETVEAENLTPIENTETIEK